jgi:hypothetical protein
MSLRHAYAPMVPEFDPFLFATVGEEVDGVRRRPVKRAVGAHAVGPRSAR